MKGNIIIHGAKSEDEISLFWEKWDAYMKKDVLPNSTLGEPITKEDEDWFFSQEYKGLIMNLYYQKINKLYRRI